MVPPCHLIHVVTQGGDVHQPHTQQSRPRVGVNVAALSQAPPFPNLHLGVEGGGEGGEKNPDLQPAAALALAGDARTRQSEQHPQLELRKDEVFCAAQGTVGCLGRRKRSPCPPACDAGAVSTCASKRSAYTKRSLHVTSSGRQGGERKGQEREERPQREPGEKGDRAPSTRPWVSLYIPTGEEGAAPASPGHRNGQAVPNGGSSPPGPSHMGFRLYLTAARGPSLAQVTGGVRLYPTAGRPSPALATRGGGSRL